MTRSHAAASIALATLIVHGCGGDKFTASSGGSAGTPNSGGKGGSSGMSSGGSQTATGGSGSAGQPNAGAPTMGGSPPIGGGPTMAGAPPIAGSSGSGGTGMTNNCSTMPLCQTCCDELYPDLHLAFASAFYTCSCDQCGQVCLQNLCSDTYNWDDACLECLQAFATTECADAAIICDDTPNCEAFASCSFSCL